MLVLQVVDGDHGGHGADARLEIGEGTEPDVDPLVLDQLAQAVGAPAPAPAPQPVEASGHHVTGPDAGSQQRADDVARADGHQSLVLLAQPGHPAAQHPRNALERRGSARGLAREQDAPAHRGIGGQRVVVVVGGDQHVLVLSRASGARREGRGSTLPLPPSVRGGAGSGSFRCACHLTGLAASRSFDAGSHERRSPCTVARPGLLDRIQPRLECLDDVVTSRPVRVGSQPSVSSSITRAALDRPPTRAGVGPAPRPAPSGPRGRPRTRAAAGQLLHLRQPGRPVGSPTRCRSRPSSSHLHRAAPPGRSRPHAGAGSAPSTCASRAARSASDLVQEPGQLVAPGPAAPRCRPRSAEEFPECLSRRPKCRGGREPPRAGASRPRRRPTRSEREASRGVAATHMS